MTGKCSNIPDLVLDNDNLFQLNIRTSDWDNHFQRRGVGRLLVLQDTVVSKVLFLKVTKQWRPTYLLFQLLRFVVYMMIKLLLISQVSVFCMLFPGFRSIREHEMWIETLVVFQRLLWGGNFDRCFPYSYTIDRSHRLLEIIWKLPFFCCVAESAVFVVLAPLERAEV